MLLTLFIHVADVFIFVWVGSEWPPDLVPEQVHIENLLGSALSTSGLWCPSAAVVPYVWT